MAVAEEKAATKTNAVTSPNSIRFDQIDVLRGLAALMVVLHHCCGHVGGGSWWRVSIFGHVMYPSRIFYHGYIGVDLFLVLSGFCLAWPVLARPDKPFHLGTYAKRRFLRIYPPYLITFLLLLFGGWACRRSGLAQFQHLGFAQPLNLFHPLGSVTLQMTNLNPAFWTLCLEARWYLLFPLVVLFARRRSVWLLLPVMVAVSALTPHTDHGPLKLLIYLPAFVAGVLAAQVHAKVVQGPGVRPCISRSRFYGAGLAVSFALCLALLPPPNVPGRGGPREVLPTAVMFFCLLLLALEYKAALSMPLRVLQRIGIFSYSLYLVHVPIIEVGYMLYRPIHYPPAVQLLYWQCVFVPIIVLLSYLFFLVAEKPFIAGSPSGNAALIWWRKQRTLQPLTSQEKPIATKETS